MTDMTPDKATALRKPFPRESIGKLPKGGTTLDYVGHAAVTDRLLTVDPHWTWEPFALGPDGLPAVQGGNLWIRLTICGVTRIGVGDGKSAKECIGDAIRNAAMRFGVALDLWAKEDLVEFAQAANSHQAPAPEPLTSDEALQALREELTGGAAPMTDRARARLFALFGEHHITDADEQRRGIAHIIGHDITSRSELTEGEAQQVIAVLAARPRPQVAGVMSREVGDARKRREEREAGAENDAGLWHHPGCALDGADHPGYLGYRCVDEHGTALPFPGEAGAGDLA